MMSEIGLEETVYEQLRLYADRLDRNLVGLKSADEERIREARNEVVTLLKEIMSARSSNPSARIVALILDRGLRASTGRRDTEFELMAQSIEMRAPTREDLEWLERIAVLIDRECSHTFERIKSRT
jgi:hypothetical protein